MNGSRHVKFGVFADLHVDIIHDAQQRLETFLEACRREDVDFIIQLGDFCYPDEGRKCVCRPENRPINIQNALRVRTYADKARILSLFRDFEKPSYHVIGNHDCDMCSKEQVFSYYGVDYGTYYSFDQGGFHFVVLDPCYFQKDGQYISYENGNYFDLSYEKEPVLPYLPPEQIQWLREDLARTPYPSVLFSHQRLTRDPVAILNPEPVREVIASAPNGVVLALNGHEHMDNAIQVDGVWFLNVNSMSCMWLDTAFACPERYSKEIDEKFPNIQYTVPYSEAVYAILTLDEKGARVKGSQASFVGISPQEQGVYAPGTTFSKIHIHGQITPAMADRYLPFERSESV